MFRWLGRLVTFLFLRWMFPPRVDRLEQDDLLEVVGYQNRLARRHQPTVPESEARLVASAR